MSAWLLQCALSEELERIFASYPLGMKPRPGHRSSESEEQKEPVRTLSIYVGDVRPRGGDDAESVPFVCLQERGGFDRDGVTVTEVLLRVAVYGGEIAEARQELSNVLHKARHALLARRVLQQRFRLLADDKGHTLPWDIPTEQNHPYAEGYILSVWEYKSIEGVMS